MKLKYDKKVDALSIRFSGAKYVASEEVREGVLFDLDAKGKIIGIEILHASKMLPKQLDSQLHQLLVA